MTEEEINKKAEKHCNEVLCNAHEKCNEVIKCRDWRSRRAGYFCGYEQALKDFEKENAELKKIKRECETSLCRAEYQYNYEQLTKAKDIIKNLIDDLEFIDGEQTRELKAVKEAEQFISEVSE